MIKGKAHTDNKTTKITKIPCTEQPLKYFGLNYDYVLVEELLGLEG